MRLKYGALALLLSSFVHALDFAALQRLDELASSIYYDDQNDRLEEFINAAAAIGFSEHDNLTTKELMETLYVARITDSFDGSIDEQENLVMFFDALMAGNLYIPNVLVVGGTRSGKSTLECTLTDPLSKELMEKYTSSALFSRTEKTSSRMTMVKDAEGKYHAIRFFDTPGFFERKQKNEQKRSNEAIKEDILRAISGKDISDVLFMLPISSGLSNDDLNLFADVQSFLKEDLGIEKNLHIVIPRSETRDYTLRVNIVEQLIDATTVIDFERSYIYFTGSIFIDGPMPKDMLDTVVELRAEFLEEIFLDKVFDKKPSLRQRKEFKLLRQERAEEVRRDEERKKESRSYVERAEERAFTTNS